MAWVLVNETSGETVESGVTLKTFRGEEVVLISGMPPHKPSSTGRVSVRSKSQTGSQASRYTSMELYPGVVGLKWEERPETTLVPPKGT